MERIEVIKGLEIERECVSRDCDRDCGKCDLVQERDWLLSVYDGAIELLKEQEPKNILGIADSIEGIEVGKCPRCERTIVNKQSDPTSFCKYCGQAVNW